MSPIPPLKERFKRSYGKLSRNTSNFDYKKYLKENKKPWLKWGVYAIIILAALGFIGGTGLIWYFSKDLPDPNKLSDRQVEQSTKIYDRTGTHVLYEIYQNQKRTLVTLDDIAVTARQATIAVEDKHFYEHKGIRVISILRAAFNNFIGRNSGGGGASTLTQQFIKKAVVGDEHSYFRKLKEAIMALRLEKKYTKDQILQMYLNEIPYGSTNYGIEAAAQSYFHKNAKDLDLAESATLAALIQAPSRYLNDINTLRNRRDLVLTLMKDQGYINETQMKDAQGKAIRIYLSSNILAAPHFVLYVKQLLAEQYGEKKMETDGYKVITTLDYDLQKEAEKTVSELSEKNLKEFNTNNTALVAIDPKTGQILAMVGSRDFYNDDIDGQYNVAVLGKRQPGSSLKPFIYAASWEKGYTPETVLYDVTTNFDNRDGVDTGYIPKNYDGKERGLITMRTALQGSLNIPAVKTLYLVGVDSAIDFLKRFGYTTLNKNAGLSLVLGGSEVNLLEHTAAYAALANNGVYQKPSGILSVEDKTGQEIFKWKTSQGQEAVTPELSALLSSVLSDNAARAYVFGVANNLTLPDRPVAAKTGTTNDNKDAWTMGYTPSVAVGVWAGNTIPSPMKSGGSAIAGKIWNSFMKAATKGKPVENFPTPPTNDAQKPVLRGSDGGIKIGINRITGKIAVSTTPQNTILEKTFLPPHDILYYVSKDDPRGATPSNPSADPQYQAWEDGLQDWIKRENAAGKNLSFSEPPTEYDDPNQMGLLPTLEFVYPKNDQLINEQNLNFKISVSAPRGVTKVTYRLDGLYIGVKTDYPFDLDYTNQTLGAGSHTLEVMAQDDVGNRITKRIVFHIQKKTKTAPTDEIVNDTPTTPTAQPQTQTKLEFNIVWDDGNSINLKSSDFPRKMFLTPTLYNEDTKNIIITLVRPDNSSVAIFTFTPGEEKLDGNNKLSFTWKHPPGSGTSKLIATIENKDGQKKTKTLTINL